METANDPGSILQNEGVEQRAQEMAERIAGSLKLGALG